MKPSTPPETAPKNPAPQQSITFDALNTGVIQSPNSLDADVDSTKAIIAAEERQAHSQLLASEAVKSRRRLLKFIALGVVLLIGLGFVVLRHNAASKTPDTSKMDASQRYSNTSIPLASLDGSTGLSVQNAQTLSINGQLNVNNSLVIAPAARPRNAVTGQLYFDQSTNKLTYYNGRAFVSVATNNDLPTFPASVSSLGGATGAVSLNNGLSVNGNTLSNTGVLTLQGESGNISLVAGNGIAVSGTTLSNTGLLSLGGAHGDISLGNGLSLNGTTLNATAGVASINGAGNIAIIDDGNGNFTITTTGQPGMGSVTSAGGTTGKLAVFDGVQDIADSLVSQSGTVVTVGGDLQVTGSLNLTNPLAVTNGGTGANTASGARTSLGAAKSGANSDITSLTGLTTALSVTQGGTGLGTLPTNSVLIGNGTSPLTGIAGTNGQCLVMSGTTPTFATCPGSGGVSSVDGLSGGITIANTTGTGSTITINDAGSSAKGIASFNATNFLVTSGAVNTVQDIAVTSTPTFANLNLTNPLGVSSGGTGRNSLTSNGVLVGNGTSAVTSTTGTNGQCLVITGATPGFTTCPGSGGVTTVNSANGAITIQGTAGSSVSTVGGVITINDATATTKGLAAFNSTNFSVTGGTVNTIQDIATTSAPSFAQLSIVSSQATGKMLTINNTNAAATGNLLDLQLNGTSKLTVATNGTLNTNGNLSVSGTVSAGTINGQTIGSTSSFTGGVNVAGSLAVNTIANTGALTVGVGGQSFTLQGNNSSMIKATNGTNTTTIAFQSPTANVTYNFGAAAAGTYDVCTTAGNCVGAGGGVTSTGGTTNKLAKFTGSNTVGDSIISDNGSTVTISGSLSVNTITPTGSLTVGSTGQNLTLQGAAVTLSATSAGITNSLVFAAPGTSNKTITLPNASGTVAVSASGPLVLDSFGNLSCPTCLSGGGGGGSGVSSLNGLSGALTLQGSDAATFSNSGTTITVSDASATVKGVAKFNGTNLTVTSGSVNTIQDIAVTAAPTFAGLTLSSALTVGNGGTGATNASGARTNLGAAASGINADITQITGLTTALSVAQGGTGIATTPTNGQILIGNGTGFSLNTLTAGAGVNITNAAGTVTISAPGSGTCTTCANTSLSNLASVAINTSLLPGTAGAANLGSATLPFGQLFLSGTSASPAANNFKITGTATAARIITLPDASGTVAVSASGYLNLSAAGNLSFTGTLAVTDGGTGANNASGARTNLGAAASGANSDITSLSGLTTALSVAQGGTGLAALTANQLLYASSSSTIAQLTNGSSGQCLVSNGAGSAPSFQTCTGAGGVSSVDGLSGALSINNTSGTGSTITINDAAADGVTKGIATFNSTNFSAISGVVNTIQGIATTSTPTFAGLTLNGTLTANTITPTGAMVIGSTSQSLTLQGSAASTITATGGGFTTTIGFSGVPAGNVTYNFDRTPAAGTYTICTTAGNCLGGSGGAKTNLSNLTSTSINQSLVANSNNALDLGSASINWRGGYFGTGVYAPLFDTVSAATLNIGTTNATSITLGSSTTVSGTLNSVSGYKFNGTSGSTVSCTSGNVLQNAIVQGGIITGGTCVANGGGFAPTLQNVYDNSGTTNPQIQLSNANGGLKLRDAASSTISNLFQIQDSAGSSTYFAVTSAGIKTASLDTVAAGTLSIGNTNATTINVATNNVSHTINIATSTTTDQFVSIGNYNGGSSTTIQGNSLYLAGNNVIMTAGNEFVVNDSLSNQLFIIEKQSNLTTIKTDLQVNGWQTTIGGGTFGQGVWINNGGLTVAGSTTYTSPVGASLQTSVSVTNQNLPAFGTVLALGVTSSSAASARGILVADARTSVHQATIGILSADETDIFGLSYDGGTTGLLKTSTGSIGIAPANTTVATFNTSGIKLSGATTVQANNSAAFQIQSASSVALFTADTSTSTITLGSSASGNYITFTAAGGLTAFGTAQHAKSIALSAEYAGGVLYGGDTGGANCSTNQNGYMTSGYDTTSNQMSYYNWSSVQSTDQCYDVVARVAIPSDFSSWNGAPSIKLKTDSTINSTYAIGIIKSDGSTYDTHYGSAYTSPGTLSTSWANMATSSLDSTGYTAGSYLTIRVRMDAKNSANLMLGDIVLTYNSKF